MKVIAEYVSDHPANDLLRIYIAGNQKQRIEEITSCIEGIQGEYLIWV